MTLKAKAAVLTAAITLIGNGVFYPQAATVTQVEEGGQYCDDIVYIETETHHEYAYYGDDTEAGQIVALIMFNNFTKEVSDDVVIAAKPTGF